MVESSSIKVRNKIAIIAVTAQPQQTIRAESLTRGLFKKLNLKSVHSTPLSITVSPLTDSDANLRSVIVESPNAVTECLIKDFPLPTPKDLSYGDYLRWAFSSIVRSPVYFWHRLKQITRNIPASSKDKTENFTDAVSRAIGIFLQTIAFLILVPIVTITLLEPLRRLSTALAVLYMVAFFSLLTLGSWKLTLPPLITWISNTTNDLVKLSPNSGLEFDMLFPVVAGVVFAAILSLIAALLGTLKNVFRESTTVTENVRHLNANLSYVFDSFYANDLKVAFKGKLSQLNNDFNPDTIFVIAQDSGALLAYEVLADYCSEPTSKPTFLFTSNLSLGGFKASPAGSVFLLLNPGEWGRFSRPMPEKLSWYHFSDWPVLGQRVILSFSPGDVMPHSTIDSQWHPWNEGQISSLINRLILLMKL